MFTRLQNRPRPFSDEAGHIVNDIFLVRKLRKKDFLRGMQARSKKYMSDLAVILVLSPPIETGLRWWLFGPPKGTHKFVPDLDGLTGFQRVIS